jgi:hypothetical protein
MMNFNWLAQGVQPVELPNPAKEYQDTITLKDLTRKSRMAEEDDLAAKDAQQIFGRAQEIGPENALKEAVSQGKQRGAQLFLKSWKEQQNIELEGGVKRALADKHRADADKDRALTRKTNNERIVNGAMFLADRDDTPPQVLQQFLQNVPPDLVPQGVNWDDPAQRKQGLKLIAMAGVDADKQMTDATTRARDTDTTFDRDATREQQLKIAQMNDDRARATANQVDARARATSASTDKASDWVVNDALGVRTNKRTGVREPLVDTSGNPVGSQKDPKDAAKNATAVDMADRVLQEIEEIRPLTEGMTATGVPGAIVGMIPGTDAFNLRRKAEMVKANLSFDALRQMRESSPTGGALGQVSDFENRMLQSTIASLDPNMDEPELKKSLDKVKKHLTNVRRLIKEGKTAGASGDFDAPPAAPAGKPKTVKFSDLPDGK